MSNIDIQAEQGETAEVDGRHEPGHQVTLECPLRCLGLETVADLVRTIGVFAAQLSRGLSTGHVCRQVTTACPLTCVDLPPRVVNALARHEPQARTVADLLTFMSSGKLAKVPNIGKHSMSQAKRALADAGFSREDYLCVTGKRD